ncbi:hypothetical protein MJ524_05340 [Escherichia coli]|nr:hypothetical protein MJ524_05340 [Escherichia coli]
MTQRAGRAGRLEPGICHHLIAKEQAERAAAYKSEPEILQSDLSGLLMELLQWGCSDPAADELAGSTANGESTGRETPVTDAL